MLSFNGKLSGILRKKGQMNKHHKRVTGAFFTPKIWVDEAHKEIEKSLGENWKDEWVVWDCCCGTANLTRDYKFKELYLSTLEQGDINDIKASGYNKEAKGIFQYDFLSECPILHTLEGMGGGVDNLPTSLQNAFKEGRKIFFLINPPYRRVGGAKCTIKSKIERGKELIVGNSVNTQMKCYKMGGSSGELYTQFLFKLLLFKLKYPETTIRIGIFSPYKYLFRPSFRDFRKIFFKNFTLISGFMFNANWFEGVNHQWGVSFLLHSEGELDPNNMILECKEYNGNVYTIGYKKVEVSEHPSISNWLRKKTLSSSPQTLFRGKKNYIPLSSAFNTTQRKDAYIWEVENLLGSINRMDAHSIGAPKSTVFLTSGGTIAQDCLPITHSNLHDVCSVFTSFMSPTINWFDYSDRHSLPNTSHPDYPQWSNDCIVYSLFNNTSNLSSLRQIDYKGKKWDVKNEFFFLSLEEMRELATKYDYRDMLRDIVDEKNRYVYKLLEETNLSPDAQEVLDEARELIRISMKEREDFSKENPKYHLQAWDAGWTQIKHLLKKHHKERGNNFGKLYKKFEERMSEGVYKFGFIKNTFTTGKDR